MSVEHHRYPCPAADGWPFPDRKVQPPGAVAGYGPGSSVMATRAPSAREPVRGIRGAHPEDQVLVCVFFGPELIGVAERHGSRLAAVQLRSTRSPGRDGLTGDHGVPRRTPPIGDERVIDTEDLLDGGLDRVVLTAGDTVSRDVLSVAVGRQAVCQHTEGMPRATRDPRWSSCGGWRRPRRPSGSSPSMVVQQPGGHVTGCAVSRYAPGSHLTSDEGVEAGGHLGRALGIAGACRREVVCHPLDELAFDVGRPAQPGDLGPNGVGSADVRNGVDGGASRKCVHDRRGMRPALRLLCGHSCRGQVAVHDGAVGSVLVTVQRVRDRAVRARSAGKKVSGSRAAATTSAWRSNVHVPAPSCSTRGDITASIWLVRRSGRASVASACARLCSPRHGSQFVRSCQHPLIGSGSGRFLRRKAATL